MKRQSYRGERIFDGAMKVTCRLFATIPQFTVADVAHAARYYHEMLGFTISGYWKDPGFLRH